MKQIFYVTEGQTDQLVLDALVEAWLGDEDFVATAIQPPESAYAADLETRLSQGWRGVRAWLSDPIVRDAVIARADCLIIHTDADVAFDANFLNPPHTGPCPPARAACDSVRADLLARLPTPCPPNVVLCVPAQDLEAWVFTALHPVQADALASVECEPTPARLLATQKGRRLVRNHAGKLKKETGRYREALGRIVRGWSNCTDPVAPRCPEAVRFETEARTALAL